MQVKIESLSHDGRGVAKNNGKTVFIAGALPHETVTCNITKKHLNFDEAALAEIITASPERIPPTCEHFSICGGCNLQHLKADAQIKYKQEILLQQLQHIGGITPQEILSPLTGPSWGYRHKARLGVKYVPKKGKVLVGFREKNSNFLADIQQCSILHPAVGTKITALSNLIYNLKARSEIAQIEVAVAEPITALIFRHLKPLIETDLEKLSQFAQEHHFYIYLQPAGIDSVHLLWPTQNESLLSYLHPEYNLKLWFKPTDFTQINSKINEKMVAQALHLLQPQKNERILDLFCGLGNFTLPLALHANQVVGVEGDIEMVNRCKMNAERNNIKNVEFCKGNLAEDFRFSGWAQQTYDKILLDPPRSGALEVVKNIARFKAKKILYVSCNPATLARDAAELIKQGYILTKAGAMDMFPHTNHVEAMALLETGH